MVGAAVLRRCSPMGLCSLFVMFGSLLV